MQVTVEYAAQIKRAVGTSHEIVECGTPCTIEQLVRMLVERHGDGFRSVVLTADGRIHPSILIFLRGEQVRNGETELRDNDTIALLSPISGG